MAGIKGLDLGFDAQLAHHAAHSDQHARGVCHHIVGLGKVHRAAIQRANFGQAFGHMGHAFGRTCHISASSVQIHRGFHIAKHDVTAHTRRQVQHHVDLGVADTVGQLTKQRAVTARRAGFRITHVAMHNCSARAGGVNRAVGDLLGRTRHMVAAILGRA